MDKETGTEVVVETSTEEVVDVKALQEALKKANSEAAANRHKAKGLEEELATVKEKAGNFRKSYVQTKATAILATNGATNPKIAKMLDYDSIDVDDNGEVIGVEAQLDTLKTDFPELFDVKRRVGRADASDKPDVEKPRTSADRLASSIGLK